MVDIAGELHVDHDRGLFKRAGQSLAEYADVLAARREERVPQVADLKCRSHRPRTTRD